jgi:hypothetical protein
MQPNDALTPPASDGVAADDSAPYGACSVREPVSLRSRALQFRAALAAAETSARCGRSRGRAPFASRLRLRNEVRGAYRSHMALVRDPDLQFPLEGARARAIQLLEATYARLFAAIEEADPSTLAAMWEAWLTAQLEAAEVDLRSRVASPGTINVRAAQDNVRRLQRSSSGWAFARRPSSVVSRRPRHASCGRQRRPGGRRVARAARAASRDGPSDPDEPPLGWRPGRRQDLGSSAAPAGGTA